MSKLAKAIFLSACVCLPLFTGCGSKEESAPIVVQRPVKTPAPAAGTDTGATPPPAPPAGASAPAAPAPENPAPATNEAVTLEMISRALQQYVAGHMANPKALTEKDLQKLVDERYIPYLPPPPAGKKYVWSNRLEVTLEKK